eukprot:309424-Hanusia_phi.AAC.5
MGWGRGGDNSAVPPSHHPLHPEEMTGGAGSQTGTEDPSRKGMSSISLQPALKSSNLKCVQLNPPPGRRCDVPVTGPPSPGPCHHPY